MLKTFPPRIFLQNWITRVDPEKANDVQLTLGFEFPDIGEQWALEVRRGVVQLHKGIPEGTPLKLTLDKTYLDTVMSGENGLLKGVLLGDVKVDGNLLDIKTFLGCFDFSEAPIALTLR
jgi:alkyl sulfatase BDS1-like metallo-beta-lactamase superfamily hydrolase